MLVSVVIPSVRATTLGQAVRSIRLQEFLEWELVVVGQGDRSELESATIEAAAGDPRIRYVHAARRGLSAARNTGVRETTGDIIAFMDDDCEACPQWLSELAARFDDTTSFVSGQVARPQRRRSLFGVCPSVRPDECLWNSATEPEPPSGFGVLGANFAVRRETAERLAGFDECLGAGARFQGGEEHDYVQRLSYLGIGLRSTPDAVIRHTFGYRYGIRALLSHKRERIRGDGAVAAKGAMVAAGGTDLPVFKTTRQAAAAQLPTLRFSRLPLGLFRLAFYTSAFRECLANYRIDRADDSISAVLRSA